VLARKVDPTDDLQPAVAAGEGGRWCMLMPDYFFEISFAN